METQSQILKAFVFLNVLIISVAHGVNIRIYENNDFSGLSWQGNSSARCYNIPNLNQSQIRSIETDTCFISYYEPNCESRYSRKHLPGNIVLFRHQLAQWGTIKSFQNCNEVQGGSRLNVDIIENWWHYHGDIHGLLKSYKNVCSCINLPEHLEKRNEWAIDNHHNSLLAYYEKDCTEKNWNSVHIAAGRGRHANFMHEYRRTNSVSNTTHKIQSFGPDPSSPYFRISCNVSLVTTEIWNYVATENAINYESTTTKIADDDTYVFVDGLVQPTNNKVELATRVEPSKEKQGNLYTIFESFLEQQGEFIKKLDEKITDKQEEIDQTIHNVSEKVRKIENFQVVVNEEIKNQNEQIVEVVSKIHEFFAELFFNKNVTDFIRQM